MSQKCLRCGRCLCTTECPLNHRVCCTCLTDSGDAYRVAERKGLVVRCHSDGTDVLFGEVVH